MSASQKAITLTLLDLPPNAHGIATRETILESLDRKTGFKVSDWYKEGRPAISIYSGSRAGAHPWFREAAQELGHTLQKHGAIAVNGGCGSGDSLMFHSTAACERVLSFTTALFAEQASGTDTTEGANPRAVSASTADYYERKPDMGLMSDAGLVLAGGYGSLDEAFEAIIFSAKHNKRITFVSTKGYWNKTRDFLKNLSAKGLFPRDYEKVVSFASSASQAVEDTIKFIKERGPAPTSLETDERKPLITLRQFLALPENSEKLQETIQSFERPFASNSHYPRIGLVASGNIGLSEDRFNLEDPKKRALICQDAATLGKDLAQQGALLVLAGSNSGLRQIVADACLKNGGQLIRLERGPTQLPLCILPQSEQELLVKIPRQHDVDRMMGLLCGGYMGICGGIHTADRVFSIVTRNQTGHGNFCASKPWMLDPNPNAPRPLFHLYNPRLGNGKNLWSDLEEQIHVCIENGFINPRDLALMDMRTDVRGMVANAIEASRRQPDLIAAPCRPTGPLQGAQKQVCNVFGVGD